MIQRYCDGVLPPLDGSETASSPLAEAARKLLADLDPLMNELAFHKALARIWEYVRLVNRYIDEQAPWALARDPAKRRQLDAVLGHQAEGLRTIALLTFSFMPHTAASIWKQLGIPGDIAAQRLAAAAMWGELPRGTPVQPAEQLFPRIDSGRPAATMTALDEPVPSKAEENSGVTVSFEEFQKLDLRVGRVIAAEAVPKANKLLKLTVDLGTEQRIVVAGIAASYRPEQVVGKSIILVANLAPRTLRGIESQGMVLASETDGQIVLASFDAPVSPGAKVT
jgi:methionyl-tRNA synthetase